MNQNFKKHLEASYTRAFEECARTGHKVGDLDAIFNSIVMATFAELIVKECVQYIEDKFDFCGDELIISEKLKEHFGVDK